MLSHIPLVMMTVYDYASLVVLLLVGEVKGFAGYRSSEYYKNKFFMGKTNEGADDRHTHRVLESLALN